MILSVGRPGRQQIQAFLDEQSELDFSYAAVGATEQGAPNRYVKDHNRVCLGHGADAFERAKDAINRWRMFELGWVEICWPEAPVETGSTVGVLAHVFGLWSLNACRVVYTVDDFDDESHRFGFAYGTLPVHLEKGEERFLVEWNQSDDSVWYDILAYSRPNHLLAKIGYPVVRQFQKRFARDSKVAMVRACMDFALDESAIEREMIERK